MTLRVVVVGAGAIGGCFVGRLLEFGADVTPGDGSATRACDSLRAYSACCDTMMRRSNVAIPLNPIWEALTP